MRMKIQFRCSICKEENYIGKKNRVEHPDKMEIQKFCPRCNAKTSHKEKK